MDIKQIKITTQRAIPLGYQGENAVVQIIFPNRKNLLSERWTLMHQRATDSEAYPVPLTVAAGGLVWTVSGGDTAVSGLGRAQLICIGVDGEILKSVVYGTVVAKSLAVGGEVPDPVKPWYDALIEEIEQIGGIDPADIQAAVEAYMMEHPVDETDPTVPEWAKQPEKPTYTAEEVGALPATYTPPAALVQSVNGKTGVVNLTADDVGALPDSYTPPEAPVKSVNGKTGTVVLDIPTDDHINDLINTALGVIENGTY